MKCYSCDGKLVAKKNQSYQYLESGLDNVELLGITLHICPDCGESMAEIPAMRQLHLIIALQLSAKETKLTGKEARFIRKELGLKSKDFAATLGYTPQNLSKIESQEKGLSAQGDRLIRLLFHTIKGNEIRGYKQLMKCYFPGDLIDRMERISRQPVLEAIQINIMDLLIHAAGNTRRSRART